ncbi:MAG: AraC family transcriptional regulator [Mycobacteriales bacterium]
MPTAVPSPPPTRPSLDWITRYDYPFPELPQLVQIACLDIDKANERTMGAHSHEILEIQYIESGTLRWWAGKETHDVAAGDAYIVRPGETHGGILSTSVHYTLHLRPPTFGERYFELPADEAAALATALTDAPTRCAQVAQPLSQQFRALMELTERRQAGPDPLVSLEARALLLHILSRIGDAARRTDVSREVPMFSAAVAAIIEGSLAEPVPAREIAQRMRCSVSQLQHRFQAEMGTTVKKFYLWRRINESCRRLEHTNQSVTEIAIELGFSSSQHFATTFRRFVGASPRAYRQGVRIPDREEPWPDEGDWEAAMRQDFQWIARTESDAVADHDQPRHEAS